MKLDKFSVAEVEFMTMAKLAAQDGAMDRAEDDARFWPFVKEQYGPIDLVYAYAWIAAFMPEELPFDAVASTFARMCRERPLLYPLYERARRA